MSFEMLELPHDVVGLALNLESDNVGAVLFGDWEKIVEATPSSAPGACSRSPSATRCSDGSSTRSDARSTAAARSRRPTRARPSSRPPASSSASRCSSRCRPV